MRWIVGIVVVLAVAGGAWFVAEPLPETVKVSRSGRFEHETTACWDVVWDVAGGAEWRTDLASLERLEDRNGHEVWRETTRAGESVAWETVEHIEGRRLIRCVVDEDGAYGGCRTVEIAPRRPSACVITVRDSLRLKERRWRPGLTERARKEVVDDYLRAVGSRLGEPKLADQMRDL